MTHKFAHLKNSVTTLLLWASGMAFVQAQSDIPGDVKTLLDKHMCSTCHAVDEQPNINTIGPTYKQLANRKHSVKETIQLIYEPQPANWPDYPPMAPMPHLPQDEVKKIAKWIVSLREKD